MPAIAAAAFARIRAETWLIPAMSTTEYVIVTSTAPTYGRVSPEASVETISFGTPTGSARIARVAIAEPPEPPSARIAVEPAFGVQPPHHVSAAARPSPRRRRRELAVLARATSPRGTSGSTDGSFTPTSTSRTSTPCSRSRSRR